MLYILKNGILHTTLKLIIIIQADLPKSGLPIQPVLPKLCLECLLQFVKVLQTTTGQNSSMEKKTFNFNGTPNHFRVTLLEQLSIAEFSGEYARPKVYENGLKNVLAIWLDLELKVKNIKNQSF